MQLRFQHLRRIIGFLERVHQTLLDESGIIWPEMYTSFGANHDM